jgi:hypothetical protein
MICTHRRQAVIILEKIIIIIRMSQLIVYLHPQHLYRHEIFI